MDEELRTIGEHLRRWRMLTGSTRQQVADAAGISEGTLARLETGHGAGLAAVLAVCRVLGIDDRLIDSVDPAGTDLGLARAHLWNRRRAVPPKL